MRILGIDPGLRVTGYGCIDIQPPAGPGRLRAVEAGVIRLVPPSKAGDSRAPTRPSADRISSRLVELSRDLGDVVERLRPSLACVESLFAHYKHPSTAIAMGHARGVILLTLRERGVPITEFKPNLVKKSLVGHGHASKEQVQRAVMDTLRLAEPPSPHDVADALAIALCAAWRLGPDARAEVIHSGDVHEQ